ncbi:MAG: LytTR family transcriptional regulator DNA-binding domain-containing protein [Lachnospiraceae bacterium]|nr:LytTR family transcriptional regulator DNA-binding domain-containing protein [Lachnospiraceae bacterium]
MQVNIIENGAAKEVFAEIHCSEVTAEVRKLKVYISNFDTQIKGSSDKEVFYVELNDILYFESVDNKTFIYTKDKVLTAELRLYEIEKKLSEKDFFRCSKSVVVNIEKIVKLKPEISRNIIATLDNGESVVISRRYVPELKRMIGAED